MYDKPVLVVGAGPTGLTLAIDLARRGVHCRVIDARTSAFEGSRGKGLQPRTLEIFEDLGVLNDILDAGGPYPKLRLHWGRLSLPLGFIGAKARPTDGVPYPNVWMMPQATTERILRERLNALGISVEFGSALLRFEQDADGVQAALSTGETLRASFLVGADGGHSTVRGALGLKLEGAALGDKPLHVADLGIDGLDRNHWHVWPFAKGGLIALCPLAGTTLFQLFSEAQVSPENIGEVILKVSGHHVSRVAWMSAYRPSVRMVNRYRVGKVFLAGDAAHVHPPAGAQGLNTGVQDAYNLGWKMAHVIHGCEDSLLDTYEAERLPIAAAVLGLSKRLLQTRSLKRGAATNQLALHYRSSSLSKGVSFGALRPGDRMPDARLPDGSRLFDHLRGPHATELCVKDGTRILIRPDGYVGQISGNPAAEYFGTPVRQVHCALTR
jgi:2-polyprenyl-6-methoxyphenol hydroxylase-like FAD-dependent oxidoreductase